MITANDILRDKLQQLIVMDKLKAGDNFYVEFGLNLKSELEQSYFSKAELADVNKQALVEISEIKGDD